MGGHRAHILSKLILFPIIQEGVFDPVKTGHYSLTNQNCHVLVLRLTFRSMAFVHSCTMDFTGLENDGAESVSSDHLGDMK